MAHVLAKPRGVKPEVIKQILTEDASEHVRATDLSQAKQFINKVQTQALKENPDAHLPHMTFLEDHSP